MQTCDGVELVFGVGDRVRHIETGITGRIYAIEMNKPGFASAIPYNVSWDDPNEALHQIGILSMYQLQESLEREP